MNATTDRETMNRQRVTRRRIMVLGWVAALVLLVDLGSKTLAVTQLQGQPPVRLVDGGLYLVLVRNPGAAFSLGTGITWVFTLIAIVVVAAIVRMARSLPSMGWSVGLGMVLGGALGNLTDRLFRPPGPFRGHVVDFLSLFAPDGSVWPVFNMADAALVCGAALLVLLTLFGSGAGQHGQAPEREERDEF